MANSVEGSYFVTVSMADTVSHQHVTVSEYLLDSATGGLNIIGVGRLN